VLLDRDLASLYEVDTKMLQRAVRGNAERFPSDFMFQVEKQEITNLRYQNGTSSSWGGELMEYMCTEKNTSIGAIRGPARNPGN